MQIIYVHSKTRFPGKQGFKKNGKWTLPRLFKGFHYLIKGGNFNSFNINIFILVEHMLLP